MIAAALGSVAHSSAVPDQVLTLPPTIFVRPGGTSYTWYYNTATTPLQGYPGQHPVASVGYYNVEAFDWDWVVTRGYFQYSNNGGETWTTYTLGTSANYIANPANVWRFVDTSPADTTTANSFGTAWTLQGVPSSVSSGGNIIPDNAPTNILSDNLAGTLFNSLQPGDLVATLTPGDTGATRGGHWQIDSQSVPDLFTLQFTNTTGNTAALRIGSGTIPAGGSTVTVTVRYFDIYQTDDSGNPIPGEGFSKQLSFDIISETSRDLEFSNDILVNSYTNDTQTMPAIATLSDGRFVVVWQSAGQDGKSLNPNTRHGIYGQLFSSEGTKIGDEFVISSSGVLVDEASPAVTALNDGRFAVSYLTAESVYDVAFRIIEADGTVGAEHIANTPSGNCYSQSIATMADGSILIGWFNDDAEMRVHLFSSGNGGSLSGELILGYCGYTMNVGALSTGSYVTAFSDPDTYEIMVRVGYLGENRGTGIFWGGYTPPRIAVLGSGFVVVSEVYDYDTGFTRIEGALFNNAGVKQGETFIVHAGTDFGRYGPSVATLSNGDFIVTWTSDSDDFHQTGIMGRRFAADGTPLDATDFQVNEHRLGWQDWAAVAALSDNRFAAVWSDIQPGGDENVKARVLLPASAAPTVAVDIDTISIGEGSSVTNTGTFSDANGNDTVSLTASIGNLFVNTNDGTWTWTFTTTDGPDDSQTVTITAEDGSATNTASFTLTVTNLPPVAQAESIGTQKNMPVFFTLTATDPGQDSVVSYEITANPTNGFLVGIPPALNYMPFIDVHGSDAFSFRVVDSDGAISEEVLVSITITNFNFPPMAGPDVVMRPNNTKIAKVVKGMLLVNDSDIDGDPLSIIAVGDAMPPGATVAFAGNFIVYTAPSTNAGIGSFTYTLSDGPGGNLVTNIVPVLEIVSEINVGGPNPATIVQSNGSFRVKFVGVPGYNYRVQYSTNLSAPYIWKEFDPLAIYIAPTNGVFEHVDVEPSDDARFYRAVLHP